MKIEWNKVTWYSKLLALILFVALPFIGFYYGTQYEKITQAAQQPSAPSQTTSTQVTSGYYNSPAEWQTDTDNSGEFSIVYPIDFDSQEGGVAPSTDWRVNADNTPGNIFFVLTVPRAFEPQTNFADAKLTVGSSKNATAVAQCMTPDQGGEQAVATSSVTINNIQFTVFQSSDAGAGNYYQTTSYRTLHNGQCYAVEYTVHSGQIANYPASYNLVPFDQAKIDSLMQNIVGTFNFL